MKALRTAARFLRRDWRAGELRLLATAVVVAVASVTAVSFFTDRIERAMARQASEVLAADLVVRWNQPPPASIEESAISAGLSSARTLDFPSVVLAGETTQLVQVKGVSPSYPLRGKLRTSPAPGTPDVIAEQTPQPGEAWLESRLLTLLGIEVGGRLKLGDLDLLVSRILTYEPDRAANLFRLAPRIMINLADTQASGLLGPASRVRHRLLLSGSEQQVSDFQQRYSDALPDGAVLSDVRAARPQVRDALDQGGKFLRLTAVTTALLCLVAVALSTRRFVERQADTGALLRCLGASRHQINAVFTWRLLLLGVSASLVGSLIGLAAQPVLSALIGNWFTESLPMPSAWPFVTGLLTGVLVLAGFALPSVLRLGQVPPLRVFRRDLEAPPPAYWLSTGAAVVAVTTLLIWQVGDDTLSVRLIGGLALTVGILLATSHLLVQVLQKFRHRTSGSWRYGLASLSRNRTTTSIQLTGFGLGLTALLLLAMVRVDLLATWQGNLPADAPNHFLINIQPDEVAGVAELLKARDIPASGPYPMIRARLASINGNPVSPASYANPRAKNMAARDFNLSWSHEMQSDNRIAAGKWWSTETADQAKEFSLETGIARTLGIEMGDTLEFDIAGQSASAEVTSLREVHWDSFNANFFVIGSPALLRDTPATFITSFHLPPESHDVIRELIQGYPSVTPLDVSALIAQVRGIMDRGSLAVEFVFLFTLLAGLVVLVASIQASRELRIQEAAVLRTLGLKRRRLLESVALEFGLLGGLAGLIAAAAATLVSYSLATGVFGLPWRLDLSMWFIAVVGGAVGVAAAGMAATWRLTQAPPVVVLRDA